ncbi:MAG: hypothetical protein ABW032_07765 [Burkholderiaceae bacterium]
MNAAPRSMPCSDDAVKDGARPIAPTDGLAGRRHAEALAAVRLAVAMATLDTAIANTALPTMPATGPRTGANP